MKIPLGHLHLTVCMLALVSAGCAQHPPQRVVYPHSTASQSSEEQATVRTTERRSRDSIPVGSRAAAVALQQVGVPYRWGGNTPQGFDCSGLVHYAYSRAGLDVPRTTREQRRAIHHIRIGAAEPGDLLFFRTRFKVSHVALYLGDGEFVHAPSTGKTVTVGTLANPYYRDHLVSVGRVTAR